MEPIRVLVIDDSAYNRQTISAMLEANSDMRVVGRAADGEEGLKLVFQMEPDIITLDLEMPRMDGFTFLRILMARRPTPVVVISGQSSREIVFRALELGALDFVIKPTRQISPDLQNIRDELIGKVRLVTQLRALPSGAAKGPDTSPPIIPPLPSVQPVDAADASKGRDTNPGSLPAPVGPAPPYLVVVGASTGGPPALLQLLSALNPTMPAGVLITQHMPPRFTRAFADRLCRLTRFHVREAEEGNHVVAGLALVAPGDGSMALRWEGDALRLSIEGESAAHRFVPSIDRMFETAALAMGPRVLGVILTGMAGDGGQGVRMVKHFGGRVVVESPDSAVLPGMPGAAIATGMVDEVMRLDLIPEAIERFVRADKP
ncbi:MAG TPA: chemotaxis-specific protein-glutamate methyltransferase CheB [Polyangia bacterium]|nr:chemotaxis-specific protein-glutamate methyltransferase CheB [Polyangia bacterium]